MQSNGLARGLATVVVVAVGVVADVDVPVRVIAVLVLAVVEQASSPGWQSEGPMQARPSFVWFLKTWYCREPARSHAAVHTLCCSTQSVFPMVVAIVVLAVVVVVVTLGVVVGVVSATLGSCIH